MPRNFRHIRLELAREPEYPEGHSDYGYLIWVPLRPDGKIDASLWREYRDYCRVLKFRPGQPNEIGHIVHGRHGWRLHYDIAGEDADETGFHLEDARFGLGEYVSIREGEETHAYRVTTIEHY